MTVSSIQIPLDGILLLLHLKKCKTEEECHLSGLVKCRKDKEPFILFRVINVNVISTNTVLSVWLQVHDEFKKT